MAIKTETTKTKTNEPTYKVLEECGTINTNDKGWEFKLRYVSWNGNPPKYDLHWWSTEENGAERCRKGLTLTGEELESLLNILKKMEEN